MGTPAGVTCLRILLVEDEALIALEAEAALLEGGHEVVGIADTVSEALLIAERTRPDLAVVDVRLAGSRTGLDLAEHLHDRGIPALLASGNCPDGVCTVAIGCLRKPYSGEDLQAAVIASAQIAIGDRSVKLPSQMRLFEGS